MEARLFRAALLAAALLSMGANYRTRNFIITAPKQGFAKQVGDAAESLRKSLAVEWLGKELPPWQSPCPIRVTVGQHLGAGGATSFAFAQGVPQSWQMSIQGSAVRILDSVLPHEVTHTVFATHFGRPLPRWADEGACTTVEHVSERRNQDRFLIEFLKTKRGIPFNRMFAMREYPADIMPLYSQGYSLARFFIDQGGKRKFVRYVGEGMRTNNWNATTKKFYGFTNLSELQLTWVEWVGQGSPRIPQLGAVSLASHTQQNDTRNVSAVAISPKTGSATAAVAVTAEIPGAQSAAGAATLAVNQPAVNRPPVSQPRSRPTRAQLAVDNAPRPKQPASTAGRTLANTLPDVQTLAGSWYARRRVEHQRQQETDGTNSQTKTGAVNQARPQPPQQARQTVIDWSLRR